METPHHLRHPLAIRWLLLVAGWVSLVLGLIGILLPVMPTTPFLLLSAACFLRSSPRFHHWLVNHRWLGSYLRLYLDGKGIPRRGKIGILVILWLTMSTTALLIVPWRWLSLTLLLIALAVSLYIIRMPEPVVIRVPADN